MPYTLETVSLCRTGTGLKGHGSKNGCDPGETPNSLLHSGAKRFLNLFKQNEIRGKRNSRFIYVGRDFYSKGDSLLVVKSRISSAHSHEQCDDDRGIETMAQKESF